MEPKNRKTLVNTGTMPVELHQLNGTQYVFFACERCGERMGLPISEIERLLKWAREKLGKERIPYVS